ncbi:MAG TPA: hypothetical protein VHG92_08030 [Afifellaceae bacterium]|nr:hypothetical protein [Afifellaceae bacterium]
MDTRLKLLALACAAPLALAACDSGQEEQQVGQVEEPAGAPPAATDDTAAPPAAQEETAGVSEEAEETQAAQMPDDTAESTAAGEPPATGEPGAPEQDIAQAPQQDTGAAAPAEGGADFTGNWALQGEACPGEWDFAEQTVEIPEQGIFEVQDIQQNGQGVELEVTSMEGEQTQTLALEFPDAQQQDTMIVRAGGDEVTLERCQ